MKPIITVHELSKQYPISNHYNNMDLREYLTSIISKKNIPHTIENKDNFLALDQLSFEIFPGEIVGILGKNGAGKSTLLKILSRIVAPTSGYVTLRGKIGALLEVGTGFHPELTGRENIYLNGSILGIKISQIKQYFNEIVEFSEIKDFIDIPLKYYSSGMQMRLAFSVAATLKPDILIMDEVLAVGDLAFQQKCLARIAEIVNSGCTILFVTHDLLAVKNLCHRAIYLKNGRIIMDGPSKEVAERYQQDQIS